MPRAVRRSRRYMLHVAYVMLAGQMLNMYLLVGPSQVGAQPHFSVFEFAPMVASLALFFWLVLRGLSAAPIVPLRDPHLGESLHDHP